MSAARETILRVDRHGERRRLRVGAARGGRKLVEALTAASPDSLWILPDQRAVTSVLHAAHELFERRASAWPRLGGAIVLGATHASAGPVLKGFFEPLVGAEASFRHLPYDELLDVVDAPEETTRDLFLGGWSHLASRFLILVRGDLRSVVAPFSLFEPTPHAKPDFRRLAFVDSGHTLRLGAYESSADAVLYELDPDYRRRLDASRRETDRSFGAALRRLRKQRRLSRSDFPGVAEKTLARIERGEVERPHPRTLAVLERVLGIDADEIATY